jgi:hypothetical protein
MYSQSSHFESMKMDMGRSSVSGRFSTPSYQLSLQVPLHVHVLLFFVEILPIFSCSAWVPCIIACVMSSFVVACYASITFQPLKISGNPQYAVTDRGISTFSRPFSVAIAEI